MKVFLFLFLIVSAEEFIVHYCQQEPSYHVMMGSIMVENCRHVKIFNNITHALWFINGERPQRKLSKEEIEGSFFYLDSVGEFPFEKERKSMSGFKFVALYTTKEIPLDKKVNQEEIVTKTIKESVEYNLKE